MEKATESLPKIAGAYVGPPKSYDAKTSIEGVEVLHLHRFVDDRGFFMELFRNRSTHPRNDALAQFFSNDPPAQVNFSMVNVHGHIKGLHYHLKQKDIWFCPPPSKMKIVLLDVRADSPTFRMAQVLVAGDGNDILVKIPEGVAHGYRPLTNPCSLFYLVTRAFDVDDPDEYRVPWDHPSIRELWDVPNG